MEQKKVHVSTPKKTDEFSIVQNFDSGYRNREDKSLLPPVILVDGSKNVLTNVSARVGVRKGYTLDGTSSVVLAPILRSFDWEMHTGTIQHVRSGFLTSAGNDGKLQFRYEDSDGNITWTDLITSLSSVDFNFASFWDFNAELKDFLLMVNGQSLIYEWSGGVTTFASATSNTITKEGVTTWAEEGFYNTHSGTVVIGATEYAYTGGAATTTITGVTPDPTLPAHAVGSEIHQKPVITLNSAMTGLAGTFTNVLISNLKNQIYIASDVNQSVYVSKVNNYKDYSYTSPVRVVGEGAVLTLDGSPTAFIPQENAMYIAAGQDQWYETKFTLSSDLTKEDLSVLRLKTTSKQAPQSQAFVTKIKNDAVFLTNEPNISTLGRVTGVVLTPQMEDISYPIINDFNVYDFGDGSTIYHRNFLYVAVPKEGLIRIYNMTNPQRQYWEAPQTIPVSCFSIIGGDIYGHSYLTSESYKLFEGYNDNGNPIDAIAKFAFNNYGVRTQSKSFNEYYVEGYISTNTTLILGIQYEQDGCATDTSYNILGTDTRIVCANVNDNSLGKNALGKSNLGGNLDQDVAGQLPPKFRVIKTFPRVPFYEQQTYFQSTGVDQQWEILAHGAAATLTAEGNNPITE